MRRRTFLLSSTTALAGTGLLFGTRSFSSTEAERGIHVDVVGDENTFLRLEYPPQSIDCEDEIQLVEIGNFTGTDLTSVTVSIESVSDGISLDSYDEGDDIVVVGESNSLGPGGEESVEVTATADEGFTGTGEVDFHVSASGPDISIETTAPRTVDIDSDCPEEDDDDEDDEDDGGELDMEFQQNGNVVKFGTKVTDSVEVWYVTEDEIGSSAMALDEKNQLTRGRVDDTSASEVEYILAITFTPLDSGTLFVSPFWDGEEWSHQGGGNGFADACEANMAEIDNIADFLDDENNFPVCDD